MINVNLIIIQISLSGHNAMRKNNPMTEIKIGMLGNGLLINLSQSDTKSCQTEMSKQAQEMEKMTHTGSTGAREGRATISTGEQRCSAVFALRAECSHTQTPIPGNP